MPRSRNGRRNGAGVVKEIREALDMTQAELGRALGIDTMTVSRYERGKQAPSRMMLLALKSLTDDAEEEE